MAEIMVLNPKRRRARRKMSALQAKYFGGGRKRRKKRNPPVVAALHPRRKRKHFVTRRVSKTYAPFAIRRRRAKRNPPVLNLAMEMVKDTAIGTVGVLANNALSNVASDALKLTGTSRQLMRVGTALALPMIAGMVAPKFKKEAALMGMVALTIEVLQVVNKQVLPLVPYGEYFTTTPEAKLSGAPVGYLPGQQYVGYLPDAPYLGSYPLSDTYDRDETGVY